MAGHHHHDHDGTARTVAVNLTVNATLTLAKWLAYFLTGSPSLFGEAAHSTADSLNPILLWFGLRRGRLPKDAAHPLGHGRETFFWSLIAAEMMLLLGAGLTAYHGLKTIITGDRPDYSPWSLGIMGFALCAEGFTLFLSWKKIRQERGATLAAKIRGTSDTVTLGILIENGVDALAVLLAFLGFGLFALTGQPLWDAGFSLAIAALLATSSLFLINRNRSLLVGETARPETVARIILIAAVHPAVDVVVAATAVMLDADRVHCHLQLRLKTDGFVWRWCSGPAARPYLAGDPVTWTLDQLTKELASVRSAIRSSVPEVASVDIEIVR
ncbi:MAG: cation diffusion facilitator family transporter [Patescibacteria group bacterium]|jgi:cation diffusion facilitator family transporter